MADGLLIESTSSIWSNYQRTLKKLKEKLAIEEAPGGRLADYCAQIDGMIHVLVDFANAVGGGINGYWALVRHIDLLFDRITDHLDGGVGDHLLEIANAYVVSLKHAVVLKESVRMKKPDGNQSLESISHVLFCEDSSISLSALLDAMAKKSSAVTLYDSLGVFWYHCGVYRLIELYQCAAAIVGSEFPTSMKSIWNRKFRMQLFVDGIFNPTDTHPFRLWQFPDSRIYKSILLNLFTMRCNTKSETVEIPRQALWIISGTSGTVQPNVDHFNPVGSTSVRCRLIRNTSSSKPQSTIVVHCHGGAFVIHSAHCHEEYLRPWVSELDGVPVLSVDYSIRKPYPVPLQEILDVYLWLISKSENVKSLLGFYPKRIVLCGDSAGAQLVMALNHVLHDITAHEQVSSEFLLPISIVALYPSFQCTPQLSPSRIVGALDPILCPSFLLYTIGAYSGIYKYFPGCTDYQADLSLVGFVQDCLKAVYFKIFKTSKSESRRNWYDCDANEFGKRLEWLANFCGSNPYLSTASYSDFNKFKKVRLYVVSSICCPILDDSALMIAKWTGPTTFDVVDKLPHGFLHFIQISKPAKEAMNLCLKRLKEAVADEGS